MIEDKNKKKKIGQRTTGGQGTKKGGGGDSVNNAGNTGTYSQKKAPTLGSAISDSASNALSTTKDVLKRELNSVVPITTNVLKSAGNLASGIGSLYGGIEEIRGKQFPEDTSYTQESVPTSEPVSNNRQKISLAPPGSTIDQFDPSTVENLGFRKGTLSDPGISDPTDTSGLSEPGSFQVFGRNDNNRNVDINGSRGVVSQNVADSLGSGSGTFNTINMDKYRESQRLTNARSAVATLKSQGASAAAQLSAFRQITKPTGSSFRDQLEAEGKGALGEGNYAKALSLSKGVNSIDKETRDEATRKDDLVSKQQTLLDKIAKESLAKDKAGLSANKDLNTLVSNISAKDPTTREYKQDKATRISLLERGFRGVDISRNTFKSSLGEEYFKEGETDEQALDRIESDSSLPEIIRSKASRAFKK